jgi:hypothetical protein
MNPVRDYKSILTEVIQKQIVILGPQITLQKARGVSGLTVLDDGSVTSIQGDPQIAMQGLIDQFVQLSGMIVRKTMEPLLAVVPNTTGKSFQSSPQARIDQALKGVAI